MARLPKVAYRCSRGHVFTVGWSPFDNIGVFYLGFGRFQRCPVGNHWALCKMVNQANLTEEERRTIEPGGS